MLFDDHGRVSRRGVLRGAGVTMALPWLEAMLPTGFSDVVKAATATDTQASATKPPVRMAFVYVPNGIHMPDWTPKAEGANFELPEILKPLAPFQKDLLVLTGLTADKARSNGDGGGDHARASSAFLTGCQPRKTDGANIRAGVSTDQYAARRVGDLTRLPSLEIGADGSRMAGSCDTGYSCAYSSTISWRDEKTPLPKETNPRVVFERIFSGHATDPIAQQRNRQRRSVLDSVMADANSLRGQLGAEDRHKLEEYLTSVRDVETRIQRAERMPTPKVPSGAVKPEGQPKDYEEHLRLLCDVMVLAFQTDSTRIGTFVFANEGSNRSYRNLGFSDGHHDLSHHGKDPNKQSKIKAINTFHVRQLAYLLGKLKAIKEGSGTLLDNCQIVYGSGNSDGDRHNHDDLPIILAGRAGGTIKTGQHIRYPKETPVTNLWLAMLDRMGCGTDRLGDSNGRLSL